ncbi:MAG: substrate-binding domain-containing protein [Desulfobacterales bacterium]|nr:MAG: substrate-binding domain-containing protein [Desulfobacterales bacterium]
MRKVTAFLVVTMFFCTLTVAALAEERQFSRSYLWDSNAVVMQDMTKYKKNPPYTIGFSNASISNSWRVFMDREVRAEAEKHKDLIKTLYVTDAQDKPDKQIGDTEDLVAKGCDLIILSAATMAALDPIATRIHKQGIPIVCLDRRVKSDNFTSFVTASNFTQGRMMMLWLCQMLKGKGNIVMLPGMAGAGPAEERIIGAKEILSQFPDVKVLDMQYTSWSPSEGKRIMAAMIQSFGNKIEGVWCDSGLQGSGAIEALQEAGLKVPITGEDLNAYLTRVQKYEFPAMSIGFPVKMGAEAVRTSLKVLQGIPVPFIVNVTRKVLTTVDTADVKSDQPWDTMAHPEWPGDWWIDNTLPQNWLPK